MVIYFQSVDYLPLNYDGAGLVIFVASKMSQMDVRKIKLYQLI